MYNSIVKTTFFAPLIFFAVLLWQPVVAQTSLPACTMSLPDHDNDDVAAAVDIDKDNDGLIEICDLEGLNEMRYQLNGSGYTTSTDAVKITQGCPPAGCKGYELMRSLDFNVADSYRGNMVDTTWTTSTGWQPIGSDDNRFNSIFEGNGHTISNLYINRIADSHLGLFASSDSSGRIQNVGLLDAKIEGTGSFIGVLFGTTNHPSVIVNSYATGNITVTGSSSNVGGLSGFNFGIILNSYAAVNVTVTGGASNIGGLVGTNGITINNSYATGNVSGTGNIGGLVGQNWFTNITNSYAIGRVSGSDIGGLVGANFSGVTTSYWNSTINPSLMNSISAKTTSQLQSPTEATGIYSDWSSDDWDFGTTSTYPALRYTEGDGLNACTTEITTSSVRLPCGIALPNPSDSDRNKGLAGIFFFADGEPASMVLNPPFSQQIYNYDMIIVAADLDIHLRPYALNNNAKIVISKGNTNYFSDNRPNGALSDAIRLIDNETTLTIVITDIIDEVPVNTTYTYVIVRWLPFRVDVSPSQLRLIIEPATPDPDGAGVFSYQWQQQVPGAEWTNIPDATTATYWLPADANGSIRYRLVDIKHTDGGGYITQYPDRGPFRASADDDGDGLIDIYTLEDLDAIRYQLNGRAYQPDENAEPVMRGCPPTGCKGYELMRGLDFNVADSYRDGMIDTTWTTSTGWQPIGSESNGFRGIFEGNGHTISGLYISSLGSIRGGLFFFLESGSEIRNIGLLNVDVGGVSDNIGGLVGRNDGSISNSYVTGVVTGNRFVGGLVGRNRAGSSITNSYATVDITGTGDNVGGLVSRNDGSIINSYATGDITGTGDNVGGLVSRNDGSIINSYATGDITGTGDNVGGLVSRNDGSIINSYATGDVTGKNFVGGLVGGNEDIITNSYATGVVDGTGDDVGGLVGSTFSSSDVIASYWDIKESGITTSAVGIGKTTDELQLPTDTTGIYRDWSSDDWDFGTTSTYPTLRYAKGGNLNACTTEITTSSTMLPCGIALPNPSDSERNKGLATVFFFADGEPASVVLNRMFSQQIYNYDMTILASDLGIQIRPYALNNNAKIAISKGNTNYFSDDRPNGALSDTIRLIDNETILTIVITDIIDEVPVNTTYTYVIVRWLPLRVDVRPSQLRFIIEPATPDPDGAGVFSYQWQQQVPAGDWTNIPDATTATYWLPADANGSIHYRLVDIKHTDGGGYITKYPDREGPFRASADDDGDGLIDIYTLEDLDAIRYQLNGRAYQPDENAEPIMRGCPATGCNGYELMRSLDFNVADSYRDGMIDTTWTTSTGWQPIGSDDNRFSGIFEGNGYTIANLLMDRSESHLGLFSVLHTNGRIQNVGLLETEVEGDDSTIGGLVASNYGSIINSYATGNITEGESVGGLVGSNYGSIINSYATGNITEGESVGGLVGQNHNRIINSYATGNVTDGQTVGGLVGENRNIITNSYATGNVTGSVNSVGGLVGQNHNSIINSYATGVVRGTANNLGGLVGNLVSGNVTASYWDTKESGIMTSAAAAGIGKTTDELQLPTDATGIYSGWSSDDWDFGTTITYPTLRYAEGGNLNTCTTEITTSSTMLPCGIALPNPSDSGRNKGLAGIFFFADGAPASVVWDPIFSQLIYHYDMSIVAEDLDIQIRPYALHDNAAIAISKGDTHYFSDDRPNGALSDTIRLDDNETITIVITDIIDETTMNTIYTFVVERLLPVQVDVSLARFSVTVASATSDPGGAGVFSYQWQQQTLESGWIDIPDATTATYWLPADANSSIPYRVNIKYTDGGGGETIYPPQGPFKASVDDDGDGLIDIYYLEDLNALRYQLDGRAYQLAADAEPIMRGCPETGCNGYELMRSLDFNITDSYQDSMIETLWTASTGWQPIGSDANRFSGIFEGNGHTIRNLLMDREGSNLGLFSVLHANGRIQNVGLLDAEVAGTGTTSRIGGLVGQNFGAIINSYVMGSVTGMSNDVGGLVGTNRNVITSSYATGNVNGNRDIGGLAGFNEGSIIDSYAKGNVNGNERSGGLAGFNGGSIINSYATGNVTGRSRVIAINIDLISIGGLAGLNRGSIINSYATGDVRTGNTVGGLVGRNDNRIINS